MIKFPNNSIAKLTEAELDALERQTERVSAYLRAAGWASSEVRDALQTDIFDIFRRKSAACPYERERARRIVSERFGKLDGPCHLVTFGNPSHRVPLSRMADIDAEAVFRHWHRGLSRLRRGGWHV